MTELRKRGELTEMAMNIIEEMMENPVEALHSGVTDLVMFAIFASMQGFEEEGLPTIEERDAIYEKLTSYMNQLMEPAMRTINKRGTLYSFTLLNTYGYEKAYYDMFKKETKQHYIMFKIADDVGGVFNLLSLPPVMMRELIGIGTLKIIDNNFMSFKRHYAAKLTEALDFLQASAEDRAKA